MVQLQRKTVEECKKFLVNPSESDIDEDEEDGDEDDLMEEGGSEECEAFKFFLRLFTEGNELRNYYEHRYEHGEFCCLVCSAIGKKGWKRFNGCLGLLQHAFAISRTKKKRAHRAYGQVICKVLGWDVDRIPTVVLKGEPLGCSLAKSSIMQVIFFFLVKACCMLCTLGLLLKVVFLCWGEGEWGGGIVWMAPRFCVH